MSTNVKLKLATKSPEIIAVDDLLLEIFIRLPLYSIIRFTPTCKNWHSLLTDPSFPKQWRKRNLKPSTGLFIHNRTMLKRISNEFLPLSPNSQIITPRPLNAEFEIEQSCNGLFLCSTGTKYYVYNPTTATFFTLPNLATEDYVHTMILAFDPNRFGPHYKVVCFVQTGEYPRLRAHVYSSRTRGWKLVTALPFGVLFGRGVYWNGAIHWIIGLSYFDIENEKFKRMPKPPNCDNWRSNYYFGESCDRLSYTKLCGNKVGRTCYADVYELKRDYSEWVLKYHVKLDYKLSRTSLLSVVHGVEEDDSFLVVHERGAELIVRHNLVSKTSEEPRVLTTNNYIATAFQYIESFSDV